MYYTTSCSSSGEIPLPPYTLHPILPLLPPLSDLHLSLAVPMSSTGSYVEFSPSWKHVDTVRSTNYTRRRLEIVVHDGGAFEVL